ncbi:hypothetical protein [Actinorugispora endophytica]|uniref:Uncharacterized protein n=1 Tax=Actinorugispora endophytica TaxID=1605990 RepID=A0A4R6VA34_9ACTN|nr:hypothetical protein [Actinorugispora endophytica]TDQ53396.1 hypothetical protein EV190_104186 [Actinorugispora endophytica]
MSAQSPDPRNEIAASLQAGRELGPEYDDAIAASLAERLDQSIAEQVRSQLDARAASGSLPPARPAKGVSGNTLRLVMGIVSLGVAIPLSAIAGGMGGAPGLLIAWIGILMVYFVVARSAD